MTPEGKTRLKIWSVLLGVFILGCLTGASLDSVYRLRPGAPRPELRGRRGDKEAMFEDLRHDLDLNDQQAAQVRVIIGETENEFRQLRAEVRPRYDAVRQKARERIRAVLTPEQQQRFDAKVAARDASRRGEGNK
jgi:Spy/CpxP family protein refolding chaperone